MREKATRTIDLYGVFIFSEGDSNLFFVLRNRFVRVFTQPLVWLGLLFLLTQKIASDSAKKTNYRS